MNHSNTTEELKILRRIQELLTVLVRATLSETLGKELRDKNLRQLYEETGRVPVRELSRRTGLGAGTISRTWRKWEQAGILVKDGKQYRQVL